MITTPESTQIDGAMALLRDCVGGKVGERLLIVRKPDSAEYYDFAPRIAANTSRDIGLTVFETVSDTFIAITTLFGGRAVPLAIPGGFTFTPAASMRPGRFAGTS